MVFRFVDLKGENGRSQLACRFAKKFLADALCVTFFQKKKHGLAQD
jgi:hypothetical protein